MERESHSKLRFGFALCSISEVELWLTNHDFVVLGMCCIWSKCASWCNFGEQARVQVEYKQTSATHNPAVKSALAGFVKGQAFLGGAGPID